MLRVLGWCCDIVAKAISCFVNVLHVCWLGVLAVPLPFQLSANVPGTSGEDSPIPWSPASLWETQRRLLISDQLSWDNLFQ